MCVLQESLSVYGLRSRLEVAHVPRHHAWASSQLGGEVGKREKEDRRRRRKVGVGGGRQVEEDRKGVEEEGSVREEWRRLGTKTVESMTEYLV